MNFMEYVTGSDITKEMKIFESRMKKLPADYQAAWNELNTIMWTHCYSTGRKLIPILGGVLGLLEETAADGQSAREVFGDDIRGFCLDLVRDEGVKTYQDKLRDRLNNNIARKTGKGEIK